MHVGILIKLTVVAFGTLRVKLRKNTVIYKILDVFPFAIHKSDILYFKLLG